MTKKTKRAGLLLVVMLLVAVALCAQSVKENAASATTEEAKESMIPPDMPQGMFPPEGMDMTPPDMPQGMFPQDGMGMMPPDMPQDIVPPDMAQGQWNWNDRGGMMDRTQMNFGGGMMGKGGTMLNEDAELTTSMDFSSYEESVTSPENPLTYYDEKDILNKEEFSAVTVSLRSGSLETSDLPSGVTIEINGDGNVVIKNKNAVKYNFVISGEWNGTVMITSDKSDYMVTLSGVRITGTTLPGMQLKSETKAFLWLEGENYVSDSSDNTKKGALTSGGDVIINGTGSLTIEAFKKHGLKVDGTVRMVSGSLFGITDENAEGNVISADDAFIMDGGYININAKGNVHATESKGIKVNGRELEVGAKGYLVINGGTIEIESVGKALTAGWKIAEDAETATTADDPTPNLIVNGGIIKIKTTGTPYEYSDEESLSPEGLEAKDTLMINGGYIEVVSTDDALNAGQNLIINGGWIMVYARGNDAIDSNGKIEINGGTVVALGGNGVEMGIDCDSSSNFTYRGGLVVSLAGGGNNTPGSSSTEACAVSFQSSGAFALVDQNGNAVVAYDIPSYYSDITYVEVLSEDIKLGETYTVLSGVTIYADDYFNGLGIGNVTVEGGTPTASINVQSYVSGSYGMDFGGAGGFGKGGQMQQGFDARQNWTQGPTDGAMGQNMKNNAMRR